MTPFNYNALPSRVIFGFGTLNQIAGEVDLLGCRRALILSTPDQSSTAKDIAERVGNRAGGLFPGAVMHTPVDVTNQALELAKELQIDCIVAVGGGSTIGLGKAIALRTDLPQIVIPTTYAGSEATPILGQTENGVKKTLTDRRVLPETIIYDVNLTLTLPPRLTVTSGINAIAHAVEALYAKNRNPIISIFAVDGIRAIAQALPRLQSDPQNEDARSDALYGAWLCGTCLGAVGMSLHHKLCHTLGGSFDLPHADVHTVVLPHAAAYNATAEPEVMARIAGALGTASAPLGLFELAKTCGAPTSLRELGMQDSALEQAAKLATSNSYWNPRSIEYAPILALLEDAFVGRPPKVSA